MQQSSLEFFCEECGAANPEEATLCIACLQPLTRPSATLPASSSIKPATIASAPTLQVVAGTASATPAMSAPLSDELTPGTMLQNRYKIECEIGRGGYSIVYRARDTKGYGRRVAIKQINLRNLTPRQIIEATETFNRETTLLPHLVHPGIPRCYSHFTDPEHWYLVMEYIKGQTLEEYLQKSTPGGYCSAEDTLHIGIALSSILEYLHARKQPLIFRDIKPANILLTSRKRLYLIDFGIARTFNPRKAKDTTPLGSPGFAAPEQYGKGQSDQRTDIYGLGATLQTLLTGRDPLELRTGEPSRALKPIPPHVQRLLASMMDPNPARRPRTMASVKQRLQTSLAKLHKVRLYFLGVCLGAALFLLPGYLLALFSQPYLYFLTITLSCLWALAASAGLFALLSFLITPSKRAIALGILTVLLLVLVLVSANMLLLPWASF